MTVFIYRRGEGEHSVCMNGGSGRYLLGCVHDGMGNGSSLKFTSRKGRGCYSGRHGG